MKKKKMIKGMDSAWKKKTHATKSLPIILGAIRTMSWTSEPRPVLRSQLLPLYSSHYTIKESRHPPAKDIG